VAGYFRQKGILVIDADGLVKSIYQTPEAMEFIKKNFPSCIENNSVNFLNLRKIAFNDLDSKKIIENFIYARLHNEFKKAFDKNPFTPFLVYDVPLLFEKNLDQLIDVSICVYCSKEMQLDRLVARDQIDLELAKQILTHQIDIEEKKVKANLVIDNTSDENKLKESFDSIWKKLII
jgi:dephospho-CoA kinase